MNQLDAMQIFVRVAELSSFTAAADSLGLPKATVSLAVQQLERLLGTRLLHRTTRSVQMTQDGHVVFERSKDLLADVAELQGLFRQAPATVSGRLRVDMPIAIARDLVIPHLPDFLRQYPALALELSSTDRRVDPVREGFDCVLRVGALLDSSLIARPVGEYRMINCASPAYLAEYGVPTSLADLSQHRLVHYLTHFGGRDPGFEYLDPGLPGTVRHVAMGGVLTVNNSEAYTAACLAGLGIVQSPEPGMRRYLASGELVEILPSHRPAPMPISLIYANRRHLPQRVQVFMSWIAGLLQSRSALDTLPVGHDGQG
ncbi:LysR family transcriptional regulator [Paludibacterium sp. B53371]|uniref:LysR family transcriptional regulator n=1 Tax=Paludibacterium sp. B53371 TaxID=2806263 RepID=UPI001C056331|nr:LysR family transcriptional regulator [Paludibacterium sp. B53371]